MRKDMSKVIVERPRAGGGKSKGRRKNVPFEDLPACEGMLRPHENAKALNENLPPLRRYLHAQIGRPWDKVYSEICENLRPTSTIQQHVRDHVEGFVAVQTRMEDGVVYVLGRRSWYGEPCRLDESGFELYVHPKTGILLENRSLRNRGKVRRKRDYDAWRRQEIEERRREVSEGVQLHKLNGCWYEVRLGVTLREIRCVERRAGGRFRRYTVYRDEVIDAGLSDLASEELYGCRGVHAVAKRQLSKRELKTYGLQND